jgi:tRNA/rRNA methyltransferase
MLDRCRIVLVRPTVAGNLGATARAMRNLGLSELVLVAPEADPADQQARQMSTRAEEILRRARIVPELGEAVSDCGLVVGTSARMGGPFRRQSVGTPEEIMPRVVEFMRVSPAALVFGPEPSGLTNAEVARCHFLIHIPTDPVYPALNLAQAVVISLYELRRCWLRGEQQEPRAAPPAPHALQERAFRRLQKALEEIHFLYGDKAEPLMHALRHLIGRAGPTAKEIRLLLGLARQIHWFVERHGPNQAE